MAAVTLSNVVKRFGVYEIIHGANIDIADGEFVVFVGPSGCGKSTLLRMIAGLEDISGGEIAIGGKVMNDVEPAERGIAMVFQSYALYPHMTVEQNLSFGLRMTGNPKADTERRVKRAAEILRIDELMAAAAEAIVRRPAPARRHRPRHRARAAGVPVRRAAQQSRRRTAGCRCGSRSRACTRSSASTMIYVTHDQTEAMTLADRIVVLKAGNVEQIGAPLDLYDDPGQPFVAGFVGSPKMNFTGRQGRRGATTVRRPSSSSTRPARVSKTAPTAPSGRRRRCRARRPAGAFLRCRAKAMRHRRQGRRRRASRIGELRLCQSRRRGTDHPARGIAATGERRPSDGRRSGPARRCCSTQAAHAFAGARTFLA